MHFYRLFAFVTMKRYKKVIMKRKRGQTCLWLRHGETACRKTTTNREKKNGDSFENPRSEEFMSHPPFPPTTAILSLKEPERRGEMLPIAVEEYSGH